MMNNTPLDAELLHADITREIIAAFYAVYDELGYGFLESVYSAALAIEFRRRGLACERELPIDVFYQNERVGHFRADFRVRGVVLLECKASKALTEGDSKQLLNGLRATSLEVGLLLHFGPRPAFKRLVFGNERKVARSMPE
jgi:GxxExxY protein